MANGFMLTLISQLLRDKTYKVFVTKTLTLKNARDISK